MNNVKFILDAFGLRGVSTYNFKSDIEPLQPNATAMPTQTIKGANAQRLDTGSANAPIYNWLGLQVFSSATIMDTVNDISIDLVTVLFEVRQAKNIDKVSVSGLNGTIKTHINDADFDISIKVVLTSDNHNDYPIEQVKNLVSMLKLPRALKIVSDFLLMFGIFSIVIEDYVVVQLEGTQNTAMVDISALSDTPIELLE